VILRDVYIDNMFVQFPVQMSSVGKPTFAHSYSKSITNVLSKNDRDGLELENAIVSKL